MGPAVEDSVADRSFAPLLIGVTGKLDLKGADARVRAALDLAFDRLDARCPETPKVLLSALARGADTVAAEAALARPDWSVVAPLPFSEALYLEDFDADGAARLRGLLAAPKVRSLVVDPLRAPKGQPFSAAELSRSRPHDGAARTDHYEQAGLYIAERAAILVAVMEADEAPRKVGGSARIVHHRLNGELDADAGRVVGRSDVLMETERLVDRHTGPVWVVDLARLAAAPERPADALLAWLPGRPAPAPLGDNRTTVLSLTLADSVELFNRQVARMPREAWDKVQRAAGPHLGDAASEVRRLRLSLSYVQGEMVKRVRRSIWLLAILSCLAILSFESYVDLGTTALTPYFSFGYVGLIALAIVLYWHAGRQRWQRIAEDYRAAAEALRVQLVWWDCGLTGRADRIGRYYLRGAHGSLKLLRTMIGQLVDACLLRFGAPRPRAGAAEAWAAGQVEFFDKRIVSRRRELVVVEGTSWFLFAASLGVGMSLAVSQASMVLRPLCVIPSAWSAPVRVLIVLAVAGVIGVLLLLALRARESSEDSEADPGALKSSAPVWIAGFLAGTVLTFGLCVLATMVSGADVRSAEADIKATMHSAKELIAIAVILPAAIAGAFRFVADKSSWAAELNGYEHAREHFRRGQAALAAAGPFEGSAAADHREIILALGAEALSENENWLRSHRERPLEPIVGG